MADDEKPDDATHEITLTIYLKWLNSKFGILSLMCRESNPNYVIRKSTLTLKMDKSLSHWGILLHVCNSISQYNQERHSSGVFGVLRANLNCGRL